jgi:hypothetical protein
VAPTAAERRRAGRTAGKDERVLYGEPETARFLTALRRLRQQLRRRERQARLAKRRIRAALRKVRTG